MNNGLPRKRVAIETLGCKLNQADSEEIIRQLRHAGYQLVSSAAEADIYILNTCTVTHIADRKARHLLRMARRQNPQELIIAAGCYARRPGTDLPQVAEADFVLTGSAGILAALQSVTSTLSLDNSPTGNFGRTRSFLKIQEGCNTPCSYCVVPSVKGREKSVSLDSVVAEIKKRTAEGYREVVLTGTKVGSYTFEGTDLAFLIGRILKETTIERLRLSSLQPDEISPQLLNLWKDERLCPHFHLALQSGSDFVLQRMKRRYSINEYRKAISRLREQVSEAAITTDIIVGFSGETEAEFAESYAVCREMGFARIHVFPYSPRQGTPAAVMPGRVEEKVKKEREKKMLALAAESARSFHQHFLGRTMPVLWETRSNGVWSGYTGNYIKVYTTSNNDLTNRIILAKLVELGDGGVRAEI